MKILIAEDEQIPRQVLRFQLEQWGHTVIWADNGRQAWELFQMHDCQLVITDWEMPEMSGIELIRRIREAERASYVYACGPAKRRGQETRAERGSPTASRQRADAQRLDSGERLAAGEVSAIAVRRDDDCVPRFSPDGMIPFSEVPMRRPNVVQSRPMRFSPNGTPLCQPRPTAWVTDTI